MRRWISREPWSARLLAGGLCLLLMATAYLSSRMSSRTAHEAFIAAWVLTATLPLAMRSLAVIPAAIALVSAALVLAPAQSAQGLVETAVAGFAVEILILSGRPPRLDAQGAALDSAETYHVGVWRSLRMWLAVGAWVLFVTTLAAVILSAADLGKYVEPRDGASLLLGALAWSVVWMAPQLRNISVSEEITVTESAEVVYRALADLPAWYVHKPGILAFQALPDNQWRVKRELRGVGVTDQIIRLLEAHSPDRLSYTSHVGRRRSATVYRLRQHNGHAVIRVTFHTVLPYMSALLGARWGSYQQDYVTVWLHPWLLHLRGQFEMPNNSAPGTVAADS